MDTEAAAVLHILWHLEDTVYAHEESTLLFTSDLHLPKLLTIDRKPYVCLTCHMKGASRLHQFGPAYKTRFLKVSADLIGQREGCE